MKKLISCVLALVLALSLVPSALAAEGASVDKFTDVPADAWYRDELASHCTTAISAGRARRHSLLMRW